MAGPGSTRRPGDAAGAGPARSPALLALLGALALFWFVSFVALGIWQLERRVWKLDLIRTVDARIHAPPVPAPGPAEWRSVTEKNALYRRVTAQGRFLNDRETLVQAVTNAGSGFWVMTPLCTDRGFTLLVNRGFVPADRRAPSSRVEGLLVGETRVTGLLRLSEPKGAFLRSNDPGADRWFSRDVAAIAAARRLGPVAPYFVDADAAPNPGGLPIGGLTVVRFPNSHLVYAITWFGLALLVAVGAALLFREERARRRPTPSA